LLDRITGKLQTAQSRGRLAKLASAVANAEQPAGAPVVFFNASARLGHLSQNAAFSLLAAWGLRLSGVRIVHFVCNAGMSRCVLGTNPDDPAEPPPCAACVAQSQRLYQGAQAVWFPYNESSQLRQRIESLDLADLSSVEFAGLPLGQLALPALRWALRRHDLHDDEATRTLLREYILSAHNVAVEFAAFLDAQKPQAVVVFNGIMFPEAVARQLALKRGLRVITHEVGLYPLSAFFTDGQATAYPMHIPADFKLGEEENRRLDDYLGRRFQGDFSMAGVRFWREFRDLDESFLRKAQNFKKIVPVFTNVIFDTSQVHANTLFADMFAWLESTLQLIRAHPETLFVIRAHPDEMRPGTRKQSRQSVAEWVHSRGVDQLDNVVFVDSGEYLNSYALIAKAHFVLVYNSSVGLEASIMGRPVLCGGAARFTQYPTVYFPKSRREYDQRAKEFLAADTVAQPAEFVRESRRVLYFQLFKTSLPFDHFLEPHARMGYVNFKDFEVEDLLPERSPTMAAIRAGVVDGKPFLV
jgi:hypothetical protein